MKNEWMIDVLTDLRRVAEKNGMQATAAELRDLCLIALAELAELAGPAEPAGIGASEAGSLTADEDGPGKPDREFAESDVA